ncbi:hypothetical protein L218DRAFT_191148 [Marasmius fiardii PR-910]|nr:hypothetical protein L218DRAFT_191148 [Marasmius fiardii PR-910]
MDFEPVDGFPAVTARSRQFRPDESDNKLIATFTEYRGDDEPPASLGNPGDVYIDKTQFILYACYDFSTAEQRWFPWCTTKIEGTHILEHPVHRDSILWAAADVSWVRKRRLENRYRKTRKLRKNSSKNYFIRKPSSHPSKSPPDSSMMMTLLSHLPHLHL